MLDIKQLCLEAAMNFQTASKAMQLLVTSAIVRELTERRRTRIFVYDAYLAILNEWGEPL